MNPETPTAIPFFTAAPVTAAAASSVPAGAPITLAQLRAHLREHPEPLTCLPNGQPLRMVASGVDMFERLTQSFVPEDFHDASIFLWCASRPAEYWARNWTPAPPENDGDAVKIPALEGYGMLTEAVAWRDAVLPAGGRVEVLAFAQRIWAYLHNVALEVDEAGLPEVPEAEKKSLLAAPTGSLPPSTPSAAEMSASGAGCSTSAITAPSSPLTAHGCNPKESPSSPPSSASGAMP